MQPVGLRLCEHEYCNLYDCARTGRMRTKQHGSLWFNPRDEMATSAYIMGAYGYVDLFFISLLQC